MTDDEKLHLQFIQSNITRMNQCSVQMKGWAITLIAAFLAVYASTINTVKHGIYVLFFIAAFTTTAFWFLDAYYLARERKFRAIYNDLIKGNSGIMVYDMPLQNYRRGDYSIFRCMFSKTEWTLYLTMIIGLIISGVVLALL